MRPEDITPTAIVRAAEDLATLAHQANAEHRAGEGVTRKGLEHFRRAGEALLEAKAQCGHGRWLSWLKDNVQFSRPTAWKYMRLAKAWDEGKLEPSYNLTDALRVLIDLGARPEVERSGVILAGGT